MCYHPDKNEMSYLVLAEVADPSKQDYVDTILG